MLYFTYTGAARVRGESTPPPPPKTAPTVCLWPTPTAHVGGQSAWTIVRSLVVGYIEEGEDDEEGKEGETKSSEDLGSTQHAPFDRTKVFPITRMPSVVVGGRVAISSETVVSHHERSASWVRRLWFEHLRHLLDTFGTRVELEGGEFTRPVFSERRRRR